MMPRHFKGVYVGASVAIHFPDRRQLADRRQRPTSLGHALRFLGRRQGFRRAREGRHTYVDCLAPRIVGLAFLVLICSALDAVLTILHLQRGGQEANLIMAWALTHGYTPFIWVKMTVTAAGGWLLAVHQQFPLAWTALHGLAGVYALLLAYHIILVWQFIL